MSYYLELAKKQGIKVPARPTVSAEPRFRQDSEIFDPNSGYRICCVCYEPKHPDNYAKGSGKTDNKDPRCRQCKTEAERLRVQKLKLKKGLL